jgi:streptomycin 6-kinase
LQVNIGRRCERAVVNAYRELRKSGTDDMAAFQSCTTLYRIHHPESGLSEARALVSEWIDHHITHEKTGAAPGCECGED